MMGVNKYLSTHQKITGFLVMGDDFQCGIPPRAQAGGERDLVTMDIIRLCPEFHIFNERFHCLDGSFNNFRYSSDDWIKH